MANNRVKYRLTCGAPGELTKYNEEYNKQIEDQCVVQPMFQPQIKDCLECPYIQIKRLT